MSSRAAILGLALAFILGLAGLTIAAAARNGITVLTFVSLLVLGLLGCDVFGAPMHRPPED